MQTDRELMRSEPDDSRVEIAQLVGVLIAAFPHVHVTEDTVRVYISALSDVPLDVLEVAVKQCLAESEFFPTVAKLRDMALNLTTDLSRQPTPFGAWGMLMDAVKKFGAYREPQFDNQLVARAVSIMGWKELCLSENQVADRAHFVKVYEQLLNREKQEVRLLPEARMMVNALTSRMSMNRLPAAQPKALDEERVPPTRQFIDALKEFGESHGIPESEFEN